MAKIDLNCDLGESFGAYTIGMDDKVIPLISSCNIACGYHASDPLVMKKTVEMAAKAGIGIGAHPGFPDLMGFGRRNMVISPAEASAYVTYQLGALYAFAQSAGVKLQHVKPHGALYNMAGKDYALALAIAKAVQAFDPSLILMGFGRRNMVISPAEASAYVTYQLGALYAFAQSAGVKLQHVKPHGALYNMAGKDYALALAIAKAVQAFDPSLILMGLAGSQSVKAAQDIGLSVAREVFADRAYMPDGSLMPRTMEGAVIHDEKLAISRVVRMVMEHKVTACDGTDIEIIPDSVCVHGDNVKALAFVTEIRKALEAEGVTIAPLK